MRNLPRNENCVYIVSFLLSHSQSRIFQYKHVKIFKNHRNKKPFTYVKILGRLVVKDELALCG